MISFTSGMARARFSVSGNSLASLSVGMMTDGAGMA